MVEKTISKDLVGHLLDGKYQLLSLLGEGGMAVVYRARRLRIDDEVAVKILRPEINLDTVSQVRFEREAQAAARIKHPNIVTIHDFGTSADGLTYLVMELLEGPNLEAELRNYNGLNAERTLSILIPVCNAIYAAHQEGIVHRDLKPSNILLHRLKDGTELVKVVDFGIVKLARNREALTQVNNLLGTPHYMSPEQCMGRDLDARSDIYSLGIIGYEMLTGRLPFNEPSIIEILQAHVEFEPPPLRKFRPDLLPGLEATILRALSKQPEQRPTTAGQFAQELMASGGQSTTTSTPANFKPKTGEMVSPSTLHGSKVSPATMRMETFSRRVAKPKPDFEQIVGRKRELDRLMEEYQQSLQSRARPIVIIGEQGVGLSRLAEEFKHLTRNQGSQTLLTRFQEQPVQGQLPFQTIFDLVRRVMSISRKQITQETNLTKWVNERLGIELPPYLFENRPLSEPEKWQAFESLSTVLARTVGERPGVLIFDNMQFGHSLVLEFLSYLLYNYRHRILFIFLVRSEEAQKKGHLCQEWIASLSRSGCEVIRLQPLTATELRDLLNAIFGLINIAERDIERIWAVSHGNPYYINETVRLLLNEGKITLKEDQWHCESIGDFMLPESLQQLAEHKLTRLDESYKEVLRQAAVIGAQFTFDLLERVTEMDEDELIKILEQVTKIGIIAESNKREEEYHFLDPTIQFVLYESIPRRRRRKFHLQVAQAMEAEAGNNKQKLQRQSARLLYHYHEAGIHDKTFHYVRPAADAARSRQAFSEAEKYYQWAIEAAHELFEEERQPDQKEWAELLISAAEIELSLGKLDDATKFLNEAADLIGAEQLLMAWRYKVLSRVEYARCSFEKAQEAAEKGLLAAQAIGNQALESNLLLMQARTFTSLGRTAEAIDVLKSNLDIARKIGDYSTESHVLSLNGLTLSLIGDFAAGLNFIEEGLKLARTHKNRFEELMALRRLGHWCCLTVQPEKALEAFECGLELARTLESRLMEGLFLNGLGDAYRQMGDMDLARSFYHKFLAMSQSVGYQSGEAIANFNLGLIAQELGILPDAVRLLENAVAQLQRLGEMRYLCEAHSGLGQAREQMGQFDRAKKDYQQAIDYCQQIRYPSIEWQARYGLASCYWTYGQADDAIEQLTLAQEIIKKLVDSLPKNIKVDDFCLDKKKVQSLLNDIQSFS